jgi:CheY-like chemotaxis protein/nitrogen-specific signal transduction histidine kinase
VDRVSKALGQHAEVVRELSDSRAQLASFLHAVGHDIRTPLVGIDATMQLLEIDAARLGEAELRARVAEASRSVRTACGFGLSMMGELFELIRSESGNSSSSLSEVDLAAICDEVATIVGPQARSKQISIEVSCVGCAPSDVASAWTDAARLRQALVNVVANAVKFSDAGPVEILLALPSPNEVRIAVRDRGPGLDESSLSKIFEPFHQSDRTAVKSGEGLGLGLTIADRCARAIGGSWSAANRSDAAGAEFVLVIPRHHRAHPAEHLGKAPPRHADPLRHRAADPRPTRDAIRVLLVDDAVDALRLAHHHLAALGFSVTPASTVREALEHLAHDHFDLVLTDFELGDGTARDLIARTAGTPVLISSAQIEGEVESAGANGIVPKPLTRLALGKAIRRVLGAFSESAKPSK